MYQQQDEENDAFWSQVRLAMIEARQTDEPKFFKILADIYSANKKKKGKRVLCPPTGENVSELEEEETEEGEEEVTKGVVKGRRSRGAGKQNSNVEPGDGLANEDVIVE